MKYYEFGDKFEMYALIGAKDIDEAIGAYIDHIYEDTNGELPQEITKEEALIKLLETLDNEEEKQIARREFKMFSEENDIYLIVIDADLDY